MDTETSMRHIGEGKKKKQNNTHPPQEQKSSLQQLKKEENFSGILNAKKILFKGATTLIYT